MEKPILVLGATGYVGGRLCPYLLKEGHRIRAVSRTVEKLKEKEWAFHPAVELAAADVLDEQSLLNAASGCGVCYYLVHSMYSEKNFSDMDKHAAEIMVRVAEKAGLERIIYLGGLGDSSEDLSPHLKSRSVVGSILKNGRVPLTYYRAAVILGSGSASFEILRYLVDRLPIMVTPRWVKTLNQPIAIKNVLEYLVGCLKIKETIGETFDIGGPDIVTYEELMRIYAEEAHLRKRIIIPVPVLTPHLSSLWIGLVSPVPAKIAKPLVLGLRNTVVCKNNQIKELIPINLIGVREAIHLALQKTKIDEVETSWMDAGIIPVAAPIKGDPKWAGGTIFSDYKSLEIEAPLSEVWSSVIHIGGGHGWYYANFLWKLRGFFDRMIGGVGLSRGRKSVDQIHVGDPLDFWRVKVADVPNRLLLVAEMKVPGIATLEFKLKEVSENKVFLEQEALFYPSGLWGILYWKIMLPFHFFIFNGMIQGIAKSSRSRKRHACRDKIVFEYNDIKIDAWMVDISESGCKVQISTQAHSQLNTNFKKQAPVSVYITLKSKRSTEDKVVHGRICNKLLTANNFIVCGIQFDHPQKAIADSYNVQ